MHKTLAFPPTTIPGLFTFISSLLEPSLEKWCPTCKGQVHCHGGALGDHSNTVHKRSNAFNKPTAKKQRASSEAAPCAGAQVLTYFPEEKIRPEEYTDSVPSFLSVYFIIPPRLWTSQPCSWCYTSFPARRTPPHSLVQPCESPTNPVSSGLVWVPVRRALLEVPLGELEMPQSS